MIVCTAAVPGRPAPKIIDFGVAKALTQKLPKEGNLRRALGEAYAAEGKTSEAITELQAAEKLNGKNPQVHLDLAKVYKKAGQAQNAAREMQQYQALAAKAKTTAGKKK